MLQAAGIAANQKVLLREESINAPTLKSLVKSANQAARLVPLLERALPQRPPAELREAKRQVQTMFAEASANIKRRRTAKAALPPDAEPTPCAESGPNWLRPGSAARVGGPRTATPWGILQQRVSRETMTSQGGVPPRGFICRCQPCHFHRQQLLRQSALQQRKSESVPTLRLEMRSTRFRPRGARERVNEEATFRSS